MTIEMVDGPLTGKAGKARYRTVRADGEQFRVRVVDADSPSFGADFEAAFRANVRRIRQDKIQLEAAE